MDRGSIEKEVHEEELFICVCGDVNVQIPSTVYITDKSLQATGGSWRWVRQGRWAASVWGLIFGINAAYNATNGLAQGQCRCVQLLALG